MADVSGQIFAAKQADELDFRIVGRVTCHHCPAMRQFAEQALGATRIRVDLQACTHFDSTFLGTLLFLRRPAKDAAPRSVVLVTP